jgi:CBS domain-containing protein
MITDRDIAIRGVAQGKSLDTPVREVMSEHVEYCYDYEDLERVAQGMAQVRVRRLPVVNREKRLVGILSLGDVARRDHHREIVAETVAGISTPGGPHRQAADR